MSRPNILIPMVGRGTRVKDYSTVPKPLVMVDGKTLIENSVESLGIDGQYIFIIRDFVEYPECAQHNIHLEAVLKNLKPDCVIIRTQEITEGQACSALLAKNVINVEAPLFITNCDQKLFWNSSSFLQHIKDTNTDACVTTYDRPPVRLGSKSPYSFIEINEAGWATALEEKIAISNIPLCGVFYWKHGKDFVWSAEKMISENNRVNNEFYIAKTMNYLIQQGLKVNHYTIPPKQFVALGNTQEIEKYLCGDHE